MRSLDALKMMIDRERKGLTEEKKEEEEEGIGDGWGMG